MLDEQTLLATIVAEIRNLIPGLAQRNIELDDSLRDLGLNSIDRVDVIFAAQAFAGVRMPMSAFAGARNIEELIRLILEKCR